MIFALSLVLLGLAAIAIGLHWAHRRAMRLADELAHDCGDCSPEPESRP